MHGAKTLSRIPNKSTLIGDEEINRNDTSFVTSEQNAFHVQQNKTSANPVKSKSICLVEGNVDTVAKDTSANVRNHKYRNLLDSTFKNNRMQAMGINGLTEDMSSVNIMEHIKNNNHFEIKNMNKIMGTRRKINAK